MNQQIKSLNKTKEIKHKNNVNSITELSNLRIATGDGHGYLTIFAVNYSKGQWTENKKKKVHDGWIASLCELSGNRLVSSSYDKTLKVWDISQDKFTLLKTLKGHDEHVFKVISLTNDIIASGSYDRTIRI